MAVDSDVKLRLYNGALRRIGSRKLASLSENREARRLLDDAWGDNDQAVVWALEQAEWNFAIRAVAGVSADEDIPAFGFARFFEKPDDLIRLAALSYDAQFSRPLTNSEYLDESGVWYSDAHTIYVRYVARSLGMESARWSEEFKELLEAKLAFEIVERVTNSTTKRQLAERDLDDALKEARSGDTMGDGVKFFPRGSWVRAKGGFYRG